VKVLVTFALETEFSPWRAARKFWAGKWGAADVFFAQIGRAEVGVLLTGMGAAKARDEAAKIEWGEYDPLNFCVSSGLAGALKPEYQIGQVLAARSVITNLPPVDLGTDTVDSSTTLVALASECGATLVEKFYCTPRVVGRADEKKHLGETADAVEMESFGVLLQAQEFGVPAVAIRAISDTSDEDMPIDMNLVLTDEGAVSIPRVLGQAAMHPQSLPGLVKLGQHSKQAAEALASFLDRYIAKVAKKAEPFESRETSVPGR
jgi:adenosylhomocysteine nucleosidase